MAVKFVKNRNEGKGEDVLISHVGCLVDCFFSLRQMVETVKTFPLAKAGSCTCRSQQAKAVAFRIRTIGHMLKGCIDDGLQEKDQHNLLHQMSKFKSELKAHGLELTLSKVSLSDTPSDLAMEMARSADLHNVVFEAVESVVFFTQELLSPERCHSNICPLKNAPKYSSLDEDKENVPEVPENPLERIKLSTTTLEVFSSKMEQQEQVYAQRQGQVSCKMEMVKETKVDKTTETLVTQVRGVKRPFPGVRPARRMLTLLEKKRKSVKPNGLHQFVLWREAYKGAKVRHDERKGHRTDAARQRTDVLGSRGVGQLETRMTGLKTKTGCERVKISLILVYILVITFLIFS